MSPENAQALDVLEDLWGDVYTIGLDDDGTWWASRKGIPGHMIALSGPEELGSAMAEEYGTVS